MKRRKFMCSISTLLFLLCAIPAAAQHKMHEDRAITDARGPVMTFLILHKEEIGLDDPPTQLREDWARNLHPDITFHFDQLQEGIPIEDAALVVSVEPGGMRVVNNKLVKLMQADPVPTVSSADAEKIAREAGHLKGQLRKPDTHLVFVPKGRSGTPDSDRLAWKICVESTRDDEDTALIVLVDAHSGEVLSILDQQAHATNDTALFGTDLWGPYISWDRRGLARPVH